MNCFACQRENPADAAFCSGCGERLILTCPACGRANIPDSRFCNECGERLANESASLAPRADDVVGTPPSPEAERRQLTVMFCDLVGSTDLSQHLDAEDLREVVRAYQQSASEVIERYEGHVAQYLGDGLLVYFGYPRAHEDDAERAVRAGREILTALVRLNDTLEPEHGIRLAARVGIHTGPVVVGEMGGGSKSETLALGDTTNIAARLEGVAQSDSVVISGATLRLVPGLFVTGDLGTPRLKGIAEPIRAHAVLQATGVRSRLDVDPSRLTPLVGRDQEVGLLLERWEEVQEGDGQVVLISGEAGLGKSRLLHAFRERLAETPHGWLECRCSPYTQGSAFQPLIALVEQGLGFQEGDGPETKLTRLEAGLEAAGLSASDVLPLIAPLLSLPLPEPTPPLQLAPGLQRKKTIEALVAWIFALAQPQPLVLLVEDLHWVDPSSVDLLGWLLEQSPTAQVLTLLSFRPDFEPPWPARSHLTPLAVKRLSRRQARNLIGGMTRDVPLPDEVVERLVERADGVPLFAEELTKMVLESGLVEERGGRYELTGPLTDLSIPTSLQDSLMARLDRLDEGKEVAQLGATLGREFFYELLLCVSLQEEPHLRAGLAQLVDAELLYQRGALPDANFTFKHALIQETAYQSLLKSVRQKFHARIARVLEEQFPERVESEPELIAHHYDEAGLAEQAVAHYQRAGERASQRSANEEAAIHLDRALALLRSLPDTSARARRELALQLALGVAFQASRGFGAPEVERAYQRARSLCEQVEEPGQVAPALFGLSIYYMMRPDFRVAYELADELLARAKRAGDSALRLQGHHACWSTQFCRGELAATLAHAEQGLEIYQPEEHHRQTFRYGNHDPAVCAHLFSAWSLLLLGHPDRAQRESREAMALARQLEHSMTVAVALMTGAFVENDVGRAQAAEGHAMELIELSAERGFPLFAAVGATARGRVLTGRGEFAAGLDALGQGEAVSRTVAAGLFWPFCLAFLLEGYVRAQRPREGLSVLAEAGSSLEAFEPHAYRPELERLEGELLLLDGGAEDGGSLAEPKFRRALELARRKGARWLELRASTSLARLLASRGRKEEACALLVPIYDWFTEGFDTQDLKDAKTLLEELGA
jgi:predicted ATPase/class 3 adenylate cyclase